MVEIPGFLSCSSGMNLNEVSETLRMLRVSDKLTEGYVHLVLTVDQWEAVKQVTEMFKLADLLNIKQAQDSYPRLLNAVKLVLAIADHQDQNPYEKISLAPKTRAQLESAVRFAEDRVPQ